MLRYEEEFDKLHTKKQEQDILFEKIKELEKHQSDSAIEISELNELEVLMKQRKSFERERVRLNECLKEGTNLIKDLNEAKKYVEQAKDWDISGEPIANIKKYVYLDEAQGVLNSIQWGLRKYHSVLIYLGLHKDEEISKFLSVSDYWIDGVFTDCSHQEAIEKLTNTLNEIIAEVVEIDQDILKEAKNSKLKKEAMTKASERFIMNIT